MNRVCAPSPRLEGIVPYDPKYLPADMIMSANENPGDVDAEIRTEIMRELKKIELNRYPDPLCTELREMIADANGLDRDCVLIGNGGDELLFNLSLAWGGPGRKLLNLPPTFSSYESFAELTDTVIVDVARKDDYSIDEDAVIERVGEGDISYSVVATPNNPTGMRASDEFMVRFLNSTDALIMADEAYFEFSRSTLRPYLEDHANLIILRTFSKAFSLAGVRMGYVLGDPSVIRELIKVRQPYSVNSLSQAVAKTVYANRAKFEPGIASIISERERLYRALKTVPGVTVYPSESNYLLFKIDGAAAVWEYLYSCGILVRDLSSAPLLENCLRVSVGTPEQNDAFLKALREAAMSAAKRDAAQPESR